VSEANSARRRLHWGDLGTTPRTEGREKVTVPEKKESVYCQLWLQEELPVGGAVAAVPVLVPVTLTLPVN